MIFKKVKPEEVNPKWLAELLDDLTHNPEIIQLMDDADEGAKKSIRESIELTKKIGVEVNEKNALGFIAYYSMVQADMFWHRHKMWGEKQMINVIAQIMMRYYKTIYELIQAEDCARGN